MEIVFNNQILGTIPKLSKKIILNNIESDIKSKIILNNKLEVNGKNYYINLIADNLINLKNSLNENEFQYNTDMYEELIPFKYSVIKKNKDIYLYSLEIS